MRWHLMAVLFFLKTSFQKIECEPNCPLGHIVRCCMRWVVLCWFKDFQRFRRRKRFWSDLKRTKFTSRPCKERSKLCSVKRTRWLANRKCWRRNVNFTRWGILQPRLFSVFFEIPIIRFSKYQNVSPDSGIVDFPIEWKTREHLFILFLLLTLRILFAF